MASRSYDDGCATAHALDLIGERWALLVVRELLFGPKRFTDLREDLRTISPNVLTQRLETLEASGIVRRRKLPPPAACWIYELTEWGSELEGTIIALGKWAVRSPFMQHGAPISRAGLLLALKAMYRPPADGGFKIGLLMPDGAALVTGRSDGIDIRTNQDATVRPDTTIAGTSIAIDGIVFGGMTLAAAVQAGDVEVSGNEIMIERFLQSFPLQAPDPLE
ncbi:MAG: winged helix-turn-helix transcriptional regulator [Parvibaculaceae bacterium]